MIVYLAELDTPFPIVDLDAVDRNVRRVQSYCDQYGLACRPHIKTHKIPEIARLQVASGAVGITCQKLGEAEVMADAGLDDILIAYPLLGQQKLNRLRALAERIRVTVIGDSNVVLEGLSATFVATGRDIGFLVECDTGLGRAGVQSPREAAELARYAADLPGIEFLGLMTYPTVPESGPFLHQARILIESDGLGLTVVSGGGSSTYTQTHLVGEVTEVRCGTSVFGDAACVAEGIVPLADTALRVRATVVSRPTRTRAIVDAGSKTLTSDPNEAGGVGHGIVVEYPEAVLYALHEEHGFLDLGACDAPALPAVGDVVTIIPNHACGCINLHDRVAAYRGDEIVGLWEVAARGMVR